MFSWNIDINIFCLFNNNKPIIIIYEFSGYSSIHDSWDFKYESNHLK